MAPKDKKESAINKISRFVSNFIVVFCIIYFYPVLKNTLFPTQMTRIEKMLRNSSMQDYQLSVDRKSEFQIVLTVFDGDKSITARIYRDVLRELEPAGNRRLFFTHTVNRNSEKVAYLSRVLMETDPDLKKLERLEVSVCGRIKNQTGNVKYDGHEPIYECEVPVQRIIATAAQ
jgi:hypothetical protein